MRSLITLAVVLLTVSSSAAQTWLVETVPIDNIYQRSSIVVDANHIPHIAATNWYDGRFYYHSRVSGVWTKEEIARYGGVGSGRAMRLDANGFARIVMEAANMAVQSATGWTVVDVPGGINWWEAMAIDPAGISHVSYVWSWGSGLYTGGFRYEWEDLAPNAFEPTWPSCEMEYDTSGNLHIVAMLNRGQPIKYWRRSQSGWVTENLGVGAWPSIALDPAGRLHVCYYAYPSRILVHAVRTGENSWTMTAVDYDGDVGADPSLCIDSQGRLNVSYYDATHGDLKFARSADGGATWSLATVESNGNVGERSSIATDGTTVHISYMERVNENEGRLHYARLEGSLTGVDRTPATHTASIRAVPNPFNPSTTIEYSTQSRGHVRVGIYDTSGHLVERLVDEELAAGSHRVQYRARAASGVYFARVEGPGTTASTKIIVLK